MTEQWRAIPRYAGLYEVSNLGRVRALTITRQGRRFLLRKPRLRAAFTSRGGYQQVHLYTPAARAELIHRLVLEAFVGPCPVGYECAHLDGNPTNNSPDNLAWKTVRENALDRRRHGTMLIGEQHKKAKLTDELVMSLRQLFHASNDITAAELARKYGVDASSMSAALWGETYTHLAMPTPLRPSNRGSAVKTEVRA